MKIQDTTNYLFDFNTTDQKKRQLQQHINLLTSDSYFLEPLYSQDVKTKKIKLTEEVDGKLKILY